MNNGRKECRVVILMLADWPFHQVMANYLLDQINATDRGLYTASVCCMNPDTEAIKSKVHELLDEQRADVFITIGGICARATKKVLDEVGGHPMVFIGLRDPVGEGLASSFEKPGFCSSGIVRESPSLLSVAKSFVPLLPVVKSVLVPYLEDNTYLVHQAREIKRYLTEQGMNVFTVPIKRDALSIMKVIHDYIPLIQGIIILEGCYSASMQDELGYLCWEKCIILCGTGPYALDCGAACGLAGNLKPIALEAYAMLRQHWEQQIPLGVIPVKVLPDNQEFFVNTDMLQRIDVPREVIEALCSQPKVIRRRIWTVPYRE